MTKVRAEHLKEEETYQKFFLFLLRRFVIETTGLDDFVVDVELESCARVHCLLDTLVSNKTKDADCLGLSDTMRTILSL